MSNAVANRDDLPALPAHLRGSVTKLGKNEAIGSGLGSAFVAPPRLSIEGGKFSVVIDGVSKRLTKKDEEGNTVGVTSLKGVILGANPGKYKLFYDTKYEKDVDPEAPKCYSYDGVTPSPYAQERQAETCAACPHNVWGSAITENGKKSRACSDNKLLAFLPEASVKLKAEGDNVAGRVYSLKVTPSALSRNREDRNDDPGNNVSLKEYIDLLNHYPIDNDQVAVPVSGVVTRIFFELDSEYPLLRFKLARFLDEEEIDYVTTRVDPNDEGSPQAADVLAIIAEQGQEPLPKLAAPAKTAALPAPVAPKKTKATDDDNVDFDIPTLGKNGKEKPADEAPRSARGRKATAKPREADDDDAPPPAGKAQRAGPDIDKELGELDGLFA